MKILTICIPCDKETKTIIRVIESCLIKEEEIEILIVNHHANDLVLEESKQYMEKYPDTIKMIASDISPLLIARGLYFKMLPAKDSIDQSSLVKVLETLKALLRIQANLDVLVCNFEYQTMKKKKDVVDYRLALPIDKVFEWHQVKYFGTLQCITMEAVIFKTNILKTMGCSCYMDTKYASVMYAIKPLTNVKAILYLDVTLHVVDARVSQLTYLNTVDECIKYTKETIDDIDIQTMKSRKMKHYICRHVNVLLTRCIVSLLKRNEMEDRAKCDELWEYLQNHNHALYKHCKRTFIGKLISKDSKITNAIITKGHR